MTVGSTNILTAITNLQSFTGNCVLNNVIENRKIVLPDNKSTISGRKTVLPELTDNKTTIDNKSIIDDKTTINKSIIDQDKKIKQ